VGGGPQAHFQSDTVLSFVAGPEDLVCWDIIRESDNMTKAFVYVQRMRPRRDRFSLQNFVVGDVIIQCNVKRAPNYSVASDMLDLLHGTVFHTISIKSVTLVFSSATSKLNNFVQHTSLALVSWTTHKQLYTNDYYFSFDPRYT